MRLETNYKTKIKDVNKAVVIYDVGSPFEFVFEFSDENKKWTIGRELLTEAIATKGKKTGFMDVRVEALGNNLAITLMQKATVIFGKDLIDFVERSTILVPPGTEIIHGLERFCNEP